MKNRSLGRILSLGLGGALLSLLSLSSFGCKGPEYAPHQPVTGVDRPYRAGSGEGRSGILQGREESRREGGEKSGKEGGKQGE